MERIEVELKPSLDDCHKIVFEYLWVTGKIKLYAVIMCVALIAHLTLCFLAFRLRSEPFRDKAVLVFPLTVFVLILLFALNVGIARRRYIRWNKRKEKGVLYFDRNGFGQVWYRDTYRIREIFYAWEEFESVYETKGFFFLKSKGKPAISIAKRFFADDNITQIRRLLANTDARKKRLL